MSNSNNRLIYLSGEPRELINNASLKLKESKEHTSRQKLYSGLVRLFNKEVDFANKNMQNLNLKYMDHYHLTKAF